MLLAIGQRLGKKLGMVSRLEYQPYSHYDGAHTFLGSHATSLQTKNHKFPKNSKFSGVFFVLELKSLKLPHFGNFLGTFHVLFHFLISGTQF